MLYLNIEFGISFMHYLLEVSILSNDWELCKGNIFGIIYHFSLGPLHVSITNRKKLNELSQARGIPVDLEDL